MNSIESRNDNARAWAGFLAGAGVGAACMYLIDPNSGARRRALLRDNATHVAHRTADGLDTARDVSDLLQSNWSPATRAIVGSIGSALAAYGARRRNLAGALASVAGAGFLLRAAANLESTRLIGAGPGRRAVDIQTSIQIAAPVDRVFDFWTHLENFPHFMRNLLAVEHTPVEGHYHWRLSGPGHVPIEFDAVITRFKPNRVLAWKTMPGSAVEHAGVIYFEPDEAGGTRVHIQFSYNPPAGAVGHAIAALAGADPKTKMDEDLARLKTMIETGDPPRDEARPLPSSPGARI